MFNGLFSAVIRADMLDSIERLAAGARRNVHWLNLADSLASSLDGRGQFN